MHTGMNFQSVVNGDDVNSLTESIISILDAGRVNGMDQATIQLALEVLNKGVTAGEISVSGCCITDDSVTNNNYEQEDESLCEMGEV